MRFRAKPSTSLAALLACAAVIFAQNPPVPPPPQGPTIPVTVTVVKLTATVTDHKHHLITDLDKQDFSVLDEGQPQRISFFSRETDLPLRIGLLLDTSNSIRERLRFEQEAATDFLYKSIRRHKDMAFAMTFDNSPELVQDYTEDLDQLNHVIQRQRAGGGTALWDAIYEACEKLGQAPPGKGPDPEVRRVLVLISDGDDNLSTRALSDALDAALRNGVVIYSISTSTDWLALDQGSSPVKIHKEEGDRALERASNETGGRVFFPYKIDDLSQSFLDIGTELRSQYTIGFEPLGATAKGQFHRIRVEVDRKGLTVRTRRGYFAKPSTAEINQPGQKPPSP